MEYLWKRYEKEINENEKKTINLKKEKRKLICFHFFDVLSGEGNIYFEKWFDCGEKISNLDFENWQISSRRPYSEWAKEFSDEELVEEYLSTQKEIKKFNTARDRILELKDKEFKLSKNYRNLDELSRNLCRVLNEYISRSNALNDKISERTFIGIESVKIREKPIKGAVNEVLAFVHSYEGPFKKLEKYVA